MTGTTSTSIESLFSGDSPLSSFQKFFGQTRCRVGAGKGNAPGVETSDQPDVVDAVDGGGVEGLRVKYQFATHRPRNAPGERAVALNISSV